MAGDMAVPSAAASSSGEMGSSLGGSRFTGTLGSNFPDMVMSVENEQDD